MSFVVCVFSYLKQMAKHRFTNLYFTTTLSITLVLFMLGLFTALLLMSHRISQNLKENVTMSVVLSDSATSSDVERLMNMFANSRFVSQSKYISKDDALREHIEKLGENPETFLGYNPLNASIELHMKAEYASNDSVAPLVNKIESIPIVQQVVYQPDVISKLDENIKVVTMIFIGVMAVLVLISIVLINSTIRLGVYSRRFLIHTMSLVGATSWRIRAPFVKQNLVMGLIATIVAIALLAGAAYYANTYLGIPILNDIQLIATVSATVAVFAILLTGLSANASAAKYVRMKYDDLF